MLIYDIVPSQRKRKEIKLRRYLKKTRELVFRKGVPFLLTLVLIVQIVAGALAPFNLKLTPPNISSQKAQAAGEGWYDASWTKRKAITVTENSGSTLTNYQVKITVAYDSDMQADFDDIRFTDENGSTLIDHWLESKTDSTTADFWVEIPSLAASSIKTIYLYYGNASATSASNGANTFEFFDDFEGTTLDTSKWTNGGNVGYSISGGILIMQYGGRSRLDNTAIYSQSSFNPNNHVLRVKMKGGHFYDLDVFGWSDFLSLPSSHAGYFNPSGGYAYDLQIGDVNSGTGSGTVSCCNNQYSTDIFYTFEMRKSNSTTFKLFDGSTEKLSTTVTDKTLLKTGFQLYDGGDWTNFSVDYIAIYKYAEPEPTASVGSEEECPVPCAPTFPYCEGLTNLTDVSDTTPEFSAIYNDPNAEDIANKYRIQVNTKSDLTGTMMWDSGDSGTAMANCTEGNRCQDISYAGTALSLDGSGYFWRIKFWDDEGYEGDWSATQSFVMRAGNWLSGWTYRAPIRIEEKSGSDLTDYQISVAIDTQSLISAGKLQSGCQDIRFTDKDGSTTIDYWIESGCNTASTEIWIEIPSLLALTAKNIYFYYGNTSASSASNGTSTFEFFDDFDDGNILNVDDGSALVGWGGVFQNISEENGILSFSDATTDDVYPQIDTGYPVDYFPAGSVIRARVKATTSSTDFWLGMFTDEWDGEYAETYVINNWTEISYTETTAFNKIGFDVYGFTDLVNDQFQIDWLAVYKYFSPEPTASVGNEEKILIVGGPWPQDSRIWLLSSPSLNEPEISNETQSSEGEAGQQQQQEQQQREEVQQQAPLILPTAIFTNNLNFGSRGVDVAILQGKLKELGFFPQDVSSTGYFGPITKEAVMKFQKSVGIYPCGIVGPRTRKALNEQEFISNNDYIFTQDLSYGSRGEEVKQIQTRLRDQNFFPYWVKSTGWFGPVTQMAVKLFQKFCNLPQTGFVGKLTRAMLNR